MIRIFYFALLSILCLFLVHPAAYSQIPNGGFENWTGIDPTGWATSNAPPVITNVTRTTSAHSGSYAVRGDVIPMPPVTYQPVLQSGPGGRGFAYSQRCANFTGYYQFFPQGGDRLAVNVELFHGGVGGTLVAIAALASPVSAATYTALSVPFLYRTGDIPDTCIVQLQIIGAAGLPTAGSYYIWDDLALTGSVGVNEFPAGVPSSTRLLQNYPNPFNGQTRISFSIPRSTYTTLKIFNTLGQEVATLASEELNAGTHSIEWNAGNAASGVYYYTLQAGEFMQTKQLILLR